MSAAPKRRHLQKSATLADVGREAGVSATAAAAVLNGARTTSRTSDETRDRVLAAAERLRYRPDEKARALALRRMNTIGIVAALPGSEPDLYFLEVLNGVLQGAAAGGQNTTVFKLNTWADAPARMRSICDGRIDGLILMAPILNEDPSAWLPVDTPMVSIHANHPIEGVVNLGSDEEAGAFEMVSRLLALGHRRILHVGGEVGLTGAERRLEAYLRAHTAAGLQPPRDHVVRDDFTVEAGRRAMNAWLDRHRGEALPDAVFAASDAIALGCIEALADRGLRVPEDISVAGFDHTLLARVSRLATVRQPLQQLGQRSAQTLIAQIESRRGGAALRSPSNIVLPTEVVPGVTVAGPRRRRLSIA